MRVKLEPRHSVFKNCIFWIQKMYEVQSKVILKPWRKSYVTSLAGVADLYQGQKNIKKNKVREEVNSSDPSPPAACLAWSGLNQTDTDVRCLCSRRKGFFPC
jgi:hypothetical protein